MKAQWNADTNQTFCRRKHEIEKLGYLISFKIKDEREI